MDILAQSSTYQSAEQSASMLREWGQIAVAVLDDRHRARRNRDNVGVVGVGPAVAGSYAACGGVVPGTASARCRACAVAWRVHSRGTVYRGRRRCRAVLDPRRSYSVFHQTA